jgi:hypothetical protein
MFKIIWGVGLFIFSVALAQAKNIEPFPSPKNNFAFEHYKEQLALEDIYIAFVQPSLISPMSYFRHTFLIFKKHGTWEFSKTFSFSAVIPNHISKKNLITDGALGKLNGRFVIGNFHEFKHAYLSKEQRGISLYKLNLTNAEKNLLIEKSFQVYDQDFSYHFFEQNCSTELIKYLSTVKPNLSPKLNNLFIKDPASTLNLLINENLILENGQIYFPKITHGFSQFLKLDDKSQKKINNHLISQNFTDQLSTLDDAEKETLANVSSLLFTFFNDPPPLYKEFQNQTFPNNVTHIPPLKKSLAYTSPARLSYGLKHTDKHVVGSISFMPSHRERFEGRFSYMNETTLKTFYAEINFNEDQLTLEQFDLFELASYNKSFSKVIIPSWRFYTGYNDHYRQGTHSLISEIGYGFSFGTTNSLASLMPQIHVDLTKRTLTSQVSALASYWFDTTNLSYGFIGNITGHKEKNNIHQLKLNIPIKHNYSVTFTNEISQSSFGITLNKRFSF